MKVAGPLAAGLQLLSEALDAPELDIAAALDSLAADAGAAVASCLGLSLSVGVVGAGRVEASIVNEGVVCASLLIPLSPVAELILYAGAPGAFVDLAATWRG